MFGHCLQAYPNDVKTIDRGLTKNRIDNLTAFFVAKIMF